LDNFFLFGVTAPQWAKTSSFTKFLDHTQRRTTFGRTPLDELLACRRDPYLTTHNTHNRQHVQASGGIRTHSLSRRAAVDLSLRSRGHWDRRAITLVARIMGRHKVKNCVIMDLKSLPECAPPVRTLS